MRRPRGRLAAMVGIVFAILALMAGSGSAAAARKKKHPKHAPASHHPQPGAAKPAANDETDDTETSAPRPPQPAGETAGEAEPAADEDEGEAGNAPDRAGPVSSRKSSRGPARDDSDGAATDNRPTVDTGPRPPPALRAGIGFGAVYRRLTWAGAHSPALSDYAMSPGSELGGWLEVYPGALVDRGLASNLGAMVSFNRGFGVSSKSAAGDVSSVIFEDFLLGLQMRFPLGFFTPQVSAAYGGQVFLFTPRLAPVPSVFYAFARLAVGARAQIANAIDAQIEAAYLAVLDSGKQAGYLGAPEYLQGLSTYGLEAGGSIGVRVTGVFGVRAGVDFRQYALDASHATGMLMADKAADRYLTIWGGAEIVLDGATRSESTRIPPSSSRPPAPPPGPASD